MRFSFGILERAATFALVVGQQIKSAFSFAWRAKTIYDVHQPKAFSFLGEVVEDNRHFYAFDEIEKLRLRYRHDTREVKLVDHGAGSHSTSETKRRISDIARMSGSPMRFGKYLFKTVDWLEPNTILELGTNLGIGTSYLASAMKPEARLISIDADPSLLACAKTATSTLASQHDISLRLGTFDDRLSSSLNDLKQIDLAFIDGHHENEATRRYYQSIKPFTTTKSVLIFDDIHWSAGMESAWEWIKVQPEVKLSIDLFRWGVVFFDDAIRVPQHLSIVPWTWKPWHMGFFSSRSSNAD